MPSTITLRSATATDDAIIATHFYQMWRDNDVPVKAIVPNWQAEIQQYLDEARRSLGYQAFVAEVNDQIVGSVECQRFAGLYPNILEASYRQDGYIWGVYVESDFRRQGIATQLTDRAIAYLRSIGCTHAVLNASPSGKSVYSRLGFADSNVVRRSLT
ncbi:MAG: GNAT family N-acetyltransferase [Verrucomicrobia bacterium]|nr:GNAT family N-acetyltransferase [Leptolyngbya sp. ES-bin-22]